MLTTLDLFAGAGGIAEGFRQAGYECLYGNDISETAMRTFAINHPSAITDCRSIEHVRPALIRKKLRLKPQALTTLVGGPPCQGFSINAPERFLEDPRNSLFNYYMNFLDEFQPRTFVFENVPGMLSMADGAIFRQVMAEFERHGYQARARILFAAHYGVPQQRWRLIILGSRSGEAPPHPLPTHGAIGRANFRGGRSLTYQLSEEEASRLANPVNVHDAIGDLPRLAVASGAEEQAYDGPPTSAFAKEMRSDDGVLFNHVAGRLSPANIERMQHIRPGGSWRDIPFDLLPAGMKLARTSDHTRRYGRLRSDGLAGTVMTKCDPHWGAVFLPDQDRALTVREAARLQSFPDAYRFLGPRVAQYEQVGNAVPPLLARAIAQEIVAHIGA
jgi:DNA (cytosine-5)-methyltransferase 1